MAEILVGSFCMFVTVVFACVYYHNYIAKPRHDRAEIVYIRNLRPTELEQHLGYTEGDRRCPARKPVAVGQTAPPVFPECAQNPNDNGIDLTKQSAPACSFSEYRQGIWQHRDSVVEADTAPCPANRHHRVPRFALFCPQCGQRLLKTWLKDETVRIFLAHCQQRKDMHQSSATPLPTAPAST